MIKSGDDIAFNNFMSNYSERKNKERGKYCKHGVMREVKHYDRKILLLESLKITEMIADVKAFEYEIIVDQKIGTVHMREKSLLE